ncbi:DUF3516 domain-containing protein, partial [Staphylococcus epidermidis]|uniref:DUF3516 domain-containing protein n=1 Tax=Staphylococcus epidermidis TaxID=1282 RepID=UPI002738F806
PPKEELEKATRSFAESGHSKFRTDPASRAPQFTRIEKGSDGWSVEQILADPEDHNDWSLRLGVRFSDADEALLEWRGMGPL